MISLDFSQKTHSVSTAYKGTVYASQLEVLYVQFFESLGIKFEYEQYQVRNRTGRIIYVPDFYLPELKIWVEIKGKDPTTFEEYKALLLAYRNKNPVYICSGKPREFCISRFYDWDYILNLLNAVNSSHGPRMRKDYSRYNYTQRVYWGINSQTNQACISTAGTDHDIYHPRILDAYDQIIPQG